LRALYLDSSAFVKVVVEEPGSTALREYLAGESARFVSSALLRTEALRAVRYQVPEVRAAIRAGLRRVELIAIDDRILDAAGTLEPRILRTLDALHVASALALGDDLAAIVTYDERMIDAARQLGLPIATPF
jgi:predicted nucleic acid-binding protein